MKPMADRLEPMPCPGCGNRARTPQKGSGYRVICNTILCWKGPCYSTKARAIEDWNTVAVRAEQGRLHLANDATGDTDAEEG